MVKFKRKLKRFIIYFGAFIAVMALTAGFKIGVFFITRSPSGPNNNQNGGQEEVESSALTEVLSNVMSCENALLDLNLTLKTEKLDDDVKLSGSIKLSFDDENQNASMLEKLKFSINGNLEILKQNLPFYINYLNNKVYAEIGEAKFVINTDNVMDDVSKILSFVTLKKFNIKITLPDLSEMNFDPSMLSMIASGLTETEFEDSKLLKFNLLGYGDVELLTDKEYFLKSIKTESLKFEGIELNACINSNLKAEKFVFNEPADKIKYTNFSGITNFLSSVDEFISMGTAKGKINVCALNQKLEIDYFADFSNFDNIKFKAKTKILEKDVIFAYLNQKLFINVDNYKYYLNTPINTNKILDNIKFYCGLFGKTIGIPSFSASEIISKFNDLKLTEIMGLISKLQIDENRLSFEYNKADFALECENSKLSNLTFSYGDNVKLNISLDEEIEEIVVNQSEFKNIFDEDLFEMLKSGIFDNKTLAFDVDAKIKDINAKIAVKLDFRQSKKAQLKIKALNKQILISIFEDDCYVEIDKVLKLKGKLSEVYNILSEENIFENIISIDNIKDRLKEFIESPDTLTENVNKLNTQDSNKSSFDFEFDRLNNNIVGIIVKNDEISFNIKPTEFEEIRYEITENYQSLESLVKFGLKLKDVILGNDLAFDVDFEYKNYKVLGKFEVLSGEIIAHFETKILNKNLIVDFQNNTAFINFDNLKVKCGLDEFVDIVKSLNLVDIGEIKQNFTTVDVDEIFEKTKIIVSNSGLKLIYDAISLNVDLDNLKVDFDGFGANGVVTLTNYFEKSEMLGYIDLYQLKPLLKSLKNTLKNRSISGNIDVVVSLFGEDNHFDINYALSFVDNVLKGKIFTTFKGLNIDAYIVNKDIYINLLGIKVHFNIDEIPEIINFANENFDANIDFDFKNINLQDKIKEINFDVIKSLSANNNFASVEFKNGFEIQVCFDEFINQVKFFNGQKTATINCTNFEEINFDDLFEEDYKDYTIFTNLIKSTLNLIKTKKTALDATISKFNDNVLSKEITSNVKLDLNNGLNLSAKILGLDQNIKIDYQNKTLFVDYGTNNHLKISIKEQAIQNILSVVCSILNIDVNSVPLLGEFLEKENIDSSDLSTILPKIEIENPLNYLEYIKEISVDDSKFVIILKSEKLGEYAKDKDVKIVISYKDAIISSLVVDNLYVGNNEYINAIIAVKEFEEIEKVNSQDFIDLSNSANLIRAVYNTVKDLSLNGNIDVTINMFGEDNQLNIDYELSYKDDKLTGHIFTTFKGLKINAYIYDKDVYLDIASIKVHFNLLEINDIIAWINQMLETNIDFDINKMLSTKSFDEIDFDFIKSFICTTESATIELPNNLQIKVMFDELINQIEFVQDNRKATIYCGRFDKDIEVINKNEYRPYTIFTNLIESTYNLIKSKKYSISGEIEKFVNNSLNSTLSITADLDITSMLNAYVDVLGLKEQITVYYENKALYFCYGGETGLKISIKEQALQEILSIACSAFNVDTQSIPFLNEFLTKEDIDSSNLSTIMPKIELQNPLSYIEFIKGFEVTDEYFAITLKAEKLGEYAKDKDVVIKLNYVDKKITSIVVNNLYVYGVSDEYINVTININDFDNVKTCQSKDKYIDLSNSKDLLRAFVNTSNLNDWHINGKVKLDIKLGSLEIKAATINVDAKIKLDENKKPTVEVALTGYPLIGLVNNKNTNGVGGTGLGAISARYRTITICYKDGEIYLKTRDEKWGAYKELIRTTKVTSQTLFDNLSYYVQYLMGFTDSIQTKIDEAIEKSKSYTGKTDYGNIIEQYSKSNTSHTIKVNLKELAHNDDIGTLTLVLTTLNNAQTFNKDYLHRLDLDLRLLDDLMIIRTENSNSDSGLYLTDLNSSLNLSEISEISNLYKNNNFGLDGEYEKEGSKAWRQENSGTRTVTFVCNNKVVSVETGNIASPLNKPKMNNIVEDDSITKKEYKFAGWFLDTDFTNEFLGDSFTRYDLTLYAKYELISTKHYAVIHFETNCDVAVRDVTGFVGDKLTLPVVQNVEIQIDENTSLLKIFKGWKTLDGTIFTKDIIENSTLTLYAVWEEKITKTFSLKIYSAGSVVYDGKVEADKEFIFPALDCFNDSTKYYTSSNFEENSQLETFVVTSNSIWYARNKFNVKITSDYTNVSGQNYSQSFEAYEGEKISLTQFSKNPENKGDYTTEYVFKGYVLNDSNLVITTDYTMKAQNLTFVAKWEVTDYCTVTFNVCWARPKGWVKDGTKKSMSSVSNTSGTNKIKVVKGTTINFSDYVATATYNYKVGFIAKDCDFKTVAWGESVKNYNTDSYNGTTSMVINSNITLQPIWEDN